MLTFPDPSVETEYTDPNGAKWEFNGTGWVRQCESSGGGDGGGDAMWPALPKPSVDILATRNNSANGWGRGTRLIQIADDGTLSDYDFVSTAGAGYKADFCPTDTLFAVIVNAFDTIAVYDYSTVPCQQVGTFKLPWEISDFGWSQGGQYIFCSQHNGKNVEVWKNAEGGWEKYAPNSRILDDLTLKYLEEMGADDPEQKLLNYRLGQLCAVNGGPQCEEAFVVTLAYRPSDSEYAKRTQNTVNLIKATPTGCVVLSGDSGLVADPIHVPSYSQPTPNVTSRVISHPQSGMFVYHGRGALRQFGVGHVGVGRAALFADGTGSCSVGSEMSERWVGLETDPSPGKLVQAVAISPSGNFLIAKREDQKTFDTFRMHVSGVLERIGVAPNTSSSNEIYHQWSADEKYIYRWYTTKIDRYEWNDGNPVFVDTQISNMESPAYATISDTNLYLARNQTHMNRSKV